MTTHDIARRAILEVADAEAHIGAFMDAQPEGDLLVIRFTSLHPGYPGWHWSAALVGDDANATVCEVWMEPGEGALAIPAWKPWSDRVRPGDLGPGDVVPTAADDVRLMPGYADADEDPDVAAAQWEFGLGRERVLSDLGIADAVDRWMQGDDGPSAQIARLADHRCSTCAWLLPIGGRLGQAFGVCAHDLSPSDGHVVALQHGCGAHSDVEAEPTPVPVTDMLIDDENEVLAIVLPREAVPTTDDVSHAEQADEESSPSDVTPPEDVVVLEDAAE